MANYPGITFSIEDINSKTVALTGNSRVLIRYHSHAHVTMDALPAPDASIDMDMYVIQCGPSTIYGNEWTFYYVPHNMFSFSAQDSLGNYNSTTVTVGMVEYERLTCNIASSRPDGDGNMVLSCAGAYFNGSFGAKDNTLTVQYRYKTESGSYSAWEDMSVMITSSAYAATAQLTGLDYNAIYTFEIMATDQLESVTATSAGVRSLPLFHWGEHDFRFEIPVFTQGMAVEQWLNVGEELGVVGKLYLGASGNVSVYKLAGTASGDMLVLDAPEIYMNATDIYWKGEMLKNPQNGTWTPTLFDGAVSYYTRQDGWYTKTGNTVTVGFFIKATCYSGNEMFTIGIGGLPYIPVASAAGSGMCSGAYVSGGLNFQCFVAETSGYITTRVQSCNHTSATNLSTSASGCCYPTGGGELTLSGTIIYQTNS